MKKVGQPQVYFMTLLLLTILGAFLPPRLIQYPYNYLGLILVLAGAALNIVTDNLFKKNKTDVKTHKTPGSFITSGPFRFTRNPMYLGILLILIGSSIASKNPISLIFSLMFFLVMEKRFIPVEEKNMQKTFGENYSRYKRRVRRWI